jgi:hypothetical protein
MTAGGDVVKGDEKWALDRQVRGVAGSIVLASILASLKFPRFRFLAGGVGFGLLFSAVTNTCAMGVPMKFNQYYLECLSHASYLIGDETTGRAVVVDPQRDIAEYLADAEAARV